MDVAVLVKQAALTSGQLSRNVVIVCCHSLSTTHEEHLLKTSVCPLYVRIFYLHNVVDRVVFV